MTKSQALSINLPVSPPYESPLTQTLTPEQSSPPPDPDNMDISPSLVPNSGKSPHDHPMSRPSSTNNTTDDKSCHRKISQMIK